MFDDYSPIVTLEGDNTVMAQQAVNFLIKQGRKGLQGKDRSKVDGVFSYLSNIREFSSQKRCSASSPEHF